MAAVVVKANIYAQRTIPRRVDTRFRAPRRRQWCVNRQRIAALCWRDGGSSDSSAADDYSVGLDHISSSTANGKDSGGNTIDGSCNYDLYAPAAVLGQSGYQTLHWTVLDNVSVAANTTTTVTLPSTTTTNVVN